MSEINFYSKVAKIQKELKAPKNQRNNFGNYSYRSCEDILEAIKPLLGDLVLTISDDIVNIGNRFYVKSTAKLSDGTNSVENTASAREADEKKGMDAAQITGASSSYARKYALNGLFCIDDTRDADATNDHGKLDKPVPPKPLKDGARAEKVNELNELLVNNSLSLENIYEQIKLPKEKRVEVSMASLAQIDFLIEIIKKQTKEI